MSVYEKMTAIADKIRAKTGTTEKLNLDQMAEGVDGVYEAGKSSMIDESKIIEKTISGHNTVSVDDVSELPHDINVQLSSDTVTDFSGKVVSVYGKNLFNQNEPISALSFNSKTYYGYALTLPAGRYTITPFPLSTNTNGYIYIRTMQGITVQHNHPRLVANGDINARTVDIADGASLIIYEASGNTQNAAIEQFSRFNIQVEAGGTSTNYESYIAPITYTPTANGKVEGIKSVSPNMTILCDGVDMNMTYRANWSVVTERQNIWNGMTANNARTSFPYGFAYGWSDGSFHPITKISLKGSNVYLFYQSKIRDLAGQLKKYGAELDTSKATSLQSAFQNAQIYNMPEISLEGITSTNGVNNIFYSCACSTIENLIFKADGTTPTINTMFGYASSLVNIKITGTIGSSISFKDCPLSVESMFNIIWSLKRFADDMDNWGTQTLTFSNDCWSKLEASGEEIPDTAYGTWRDYIEGSIGWLTA